MINWILDFNAEGIRTARHARCALGVMLLLMGIGFAVIAISTSFQSDGLAPFVFSALFGVVAVFMLLTGVFHLRKKEWHPRVEEQKAWVGEE
jgi:hypothetical protein